MSHSPKSNPAGSYHGLSIPPQPYHQKPQSCRCCLLSTTYKTLIALCIFLGIAILVLWLIFRPHKIKAAVETATLTRFNLTGTNLTSLSYNLSADISLRNSYRRVGIYYDDLHGETYYNGERFGFMTLPTFYQGHKNTTMLHPVMEGTSVFGLESSGMDEFRNEEKMGFFNVDVWLIGQIRYKFGSVVSRRRRLRVRCNKLRVPLVTKETPGAAGFGRTECHVAHY
ncbi:NDR1/HIN1-like protein 10 [Phoenix dactylifera]|uniref:NDR1/HIN1-like protein 10 n=1 Tax=Phoenix dactylifera TaxID=42345 RepID=A0A8B7CZY8_PHODC|nr:NDR1/HIN1-like protein 10 [Phoenix dactylifera]XP_038976579.1 NDR1/HIN1-like protein 10 [Phoenix dactylifera]